MCIMKREAKGKSGKESETAHMAPNSFAPTFGSVPSEFAGRRQLVEDVIDGLDNAPGDPNHASIFIGLKGLAKPSSSRR
jgi:hypothetical protein